MEKLWLKNYQTGVPATIEDQMAKYRSLGDVFEEAFSKFSQSPAFHCMGKTISYQELDHLSQKFASYLQNTLKLKKSQTKLLSL